MASRISLNVRSSKNRVGGAVCARATDGTASRAARVNAESLIGSVRVRFVGIRAGLDPDAVGPVRPEGPAGTPGRPGAERRGRAGTAPEAGSRPVFPLINPLT